ncbi:hypothetical protein B0J18DRAFT_258448 [Chaetomium sp. MPI-SDFR-AT-0129]|nr:hypothetical protein B0J18DRAFT_258448 [Chaetomium sp. MPI-SDFR-AT-0129]
MPNNPRYTGPRGSSRPPPRDSRNDRDSRHRNGPQPRDPFRPQADFFRRPQDAPPPPPMSYRGPPGVDNYRPPQGDFNFRVDKPAGVQDGDSYRPQGNRKNYSGRRSLSPDRDSRPSKRNRGPHDRSFRSHNGPPPFRDNRHGRNFHRPRRPPPIPAERDLLKIDHESGTEVAFYNTAGGVTYRPLNELSDSDEAEMDISGDEAGSDGEPSIKRARVGMERSESDNKAPKWSNPDPYTALPPESSTQGKKRDVVRMIRKSRVQETETRASLPSETADFISFDTESEHSGDDLDHGEEPLSATTARDLQLPPKPSAVGQLGNAPATTSPSLQLPAKPSVIAEPDYRPAILPDPLSSALGSRKRTHDDEIKMPHAKFRKVTKLRSGGAITNEWLPDPELDSTPWMKTDHSASANMAVWLHKEVVDFYDYIKPRDFEERLRHEVVQELKGFCRQIYRDAEVYCFGSFPSGLYLPTADMDMAFMSDGYANGGMAKYCTKSFLFRFRSQLIARNMTWQNEIEVISGAKVPLVKFIERKTGLKIDVSFENDTGVKAIHTFKAWRAQYPGMPALVTLIKHFLLMRGLNEPVNGGIGGFSVICLVVSMLQMMPEVQSRNLDTKHHLGQLLLQFFDLYGNKFNYQTVAISLDPPRYIPKHQVTDFAYKNHDRLSIIDPNNSANDISGGSSNTGTILSHFARAHEDLTERMAQLAQDPRNASQSILEVIMGGNYSSFETQRNYLELLSKEGYRPPTRPSNDPLDRDRDRDRGNRSSRGQPPATGPSHGRNSGYRRRK